MTWLCWRNQRQGGSGLRRSWLAETTARLGNSSCSRQPQLLVPRIGRTVLGREFDGAPNPIRKAAVSGCSDSMFDITKESNGSSMQLLASVDAPR